jgi:hypothetical protein
VCVCACVRVYVCVCVCEGRVVYEQPITIPISNEALIADPKLQAEIEELVIKAVRAF